MSAVIWMGLEADYAPEEKKQMAALSVNEQSTIHVLKSLTAGRLYSSEDLYAGRIELPKTPLLPTSANEGISATVYIDHEDIPFGESQTPLAGNVRIPRKRPIYALAWTWKRHRIYKTKGAAEKAMAWWRKNHEAMGWKLQKVAGGYIAQSVNGERRAITLHEYDAATHQRIS